MFTTHQHHAVPAHTTLLLVTAILLGLAASTLFGATGNGRNADPPALLPPEAYEAAAPMNNVPAATFAADAWEAIEQQNAGRWEEAAAIWERTSAPCESELWRHLSLGVAQLYLGNLEPARVGWGAARQADQVFNRRWKMTPGTPLPNPFGGQDRVLMNPGTGNPNLLEPAGPTDPEIRFISIQSATGRPIALLANYSLHYVGGTGGPQISADYFGMFADRIQQLLGADRLDPPFVGIMSNGTSGDVKHATARLDTGQVKHHLCCGSINFLPRDLSSAPPISALRESPFFTWKSCHRPSSYFRDSIETTFCAIPDMPNATGEKRASRLSQPDGLGLL
jgi:hypothetical protein